MNSVCEAMTYGVPMLVLPILNDQPINDTQVVELKIGKRLRFLGVSAKELAEEAFSILADREMKGRCEEIKYKIAANLKISDAAEAIESYLAKN